MFELVFLGTAAAVPSAERGLPALFVGHGADRFLVDCGEGTLRQLLRAGLGLRGLGRVLPTHAHLDHVAGLAGLVATRALWGLSDPIEIIGSGETVEFVRRYLAVTIGAEHEAPYRLHAVAPGLVLSRPGWRLDAFAVAHRGTRSLGYRFEEAARRPLLAERLTSLGVPEGAARGELAAGRALTLPDGRVIAPEMVQGPESAGARLAVIGDVEEVAFLTEHVRAADAVVIEATFLYRDNALARSRGHLTAAAAARLAREAAIGELLLTHISARYRPEEIAAEAIGIFPRTRVVADFEHISIAARSNSAKRGC
jgi:ribonuclease Z